MKSARNDYKEKPFYYKEDFEGQRKTVAWDEATESQKKILYGIMDLMDERIEYLFKEDTGEGDGYSRWSRIIGGIYKTTLLELISSYEKWFFNDSIFQFCFKAPGQDEYVAYDEHGLFFIYGVSGCEEVLKRIGLKNSKRALIINEPHWSVRPKDSECSLNKFKKQLKSRSVLYEDESEQVDGD
jgi:hypothetical protein